MYLLKRASPLLFVLLAIPTPTRSQEKSSSPKTSVTQPSHYPDTTAGLRQLLESMLKAARENDLQNLTAILKDTEVPNCDAWLHAMYEPDKADSWMDLCDAESRSTSEKSLMQFFGNFVKEDGQILTRKVNDNPEPGRGMEWGWLQAIRHPLDIYFAAWATSKNPKGEAIGYFMFIDGGFRWESTVQFVKPAIGNSKVVPPKLVTKIEPVYPPEAKANHISGIVRVSFVIGADGFVYNAHAMSGEGLSNDPSLRKAAEDAVTKWRYTPGTLDGKPAETNAVTVDITFASRN